MRSRSCGASASTRPSSASAAPNGSPLSGPVDVGGVEQGEPRIERRLTSALAAATSSPLKRHMPQAIGATVNWPSEMEV
jgi:hypothetical protein